MADVTSHRRLPLSAMRPLYRRARFAANYVQGTMSLEGQGLPRAGVRKLVRQAFARSVRAALAAA